MTEGKENVAPTTLESLIFGSYKLHNLDFVRELSLIKIVFLSIFWNLLSFFIVGYDKCIAKTLTIY